MSNVPPRRHVFRVIWTAFLVSIFFLPLPSDAQRLTIYEENQVYNHILKFDRDGIFVKEWGPDGTKDGQFLHIHGIASDDLGNVYAVDQEKNEIQKFDSDGNFITKWGSRGSGEGQFSSRLEDITVDSDGNVYVADSGQSRIQKFSSDGEFITKWGSEGSGDGQFRRPVGLATDSSGNVYVTDRDNNRVQKFSSDGEFITKWGSNGVGDGQFNWPAAIVVDHFNDMVFVVDEANDTVQKFDASGKFITKWGSKGSEDGQFNAPRGIAIDLRGHLYIVDAKNQRIQKFDSNGVFVAAFGTVGNGHGGFVHPWDITIDRLGNIYLSDQKLQHPELHIVSEFVALEANTSPTNGVYRVQNEYYNFVLKWGSKGTEDGQFERPHDITSDSLGNLYVSDRDRNDIQVFSHSGRFLFKFGSEGTGSGEFRIPYSVSIDEERGFLYVADRENSRIQKFDLEGTFIEKFEAPPGNSDEPFYLPEDIAIDRRSGSIYVADTGNNRIVKLDREFRFISQWGSEGTGPGQFIHPHGIGVDSRGDVYVNELDNPRIQKFDANGNFIKQWGSAGRGDGQFTPPIEHLEVDAFDNVWMVDGADSPRIIKFDSNGAFLGSVGSGPCVITDDIKTNPSIMNGPLQCDGKLDKPEHVHIDSAGNLYVVDRGNQRVEMFLRSESPLSLSGANCFYEQLGGNPCLTLQTVISDLIFPTGMAFLSTDDILVIEKNRGTVHRYINGERQDEPLLRVNVATEGNEQGMLGITVASKNSITGNEDGTTYVFLYYTEAETEDGPPIGNKLYRYELVDNKLINPKLIFSLPAGLAHNGGVVTIGPDGNIYLVIGNLFSERLGLRPWDNLGDTLAQNVEGAPMPDGRGGILRFTLDGETVDDEGILGDSYPLNKYYAYGIRNSFGIAFDPLTGALWDTENGPNNGDEVNLVEPGFNSGSNPIHGMKGDSSVGLVSFDGRGKYSEPEFVWDITVAPTAIAFLDSNKLGEEYRNDIFVGSAADMLFHFDLNEDRTGLLLNSPLSDRVADRLPDLEDVIFGVDFGIITDIETGPDGYLYVLSVLGEGKIFRVIPSSTTQTFDWPGEEHILNLGRVQKFDSDGNFITKWGSKGSGDGEFLHIHGVAALRSGYVYTTDEARGIVQKFDSDGNFITKWGSKGSGDGEFSSKIEDVTVDSRGNVYVVDYGYHRIQKFDNDGNFITKWGSKGSGDGEFDRPWGIATDSLGNVYVSDQRNNRIQKFSSDGEFITKWGSEGSGDGQFVHLHAIAIDSDDNVYVSDARENGRIQKFSSDGEFITKWGSEGSGDGQFKEHHGIAFDPEGNVYVADTANQRIQKFTSEGEFIGKWDMSGGYEFIMPQDIAIDSSGNVYVTDVADAHPEISYVNRFLKDRGYIVNVSPALDDHDEIQKTTTVMLTDRGGINVAVRWGSGQLYADVEVPLRVDFSDSLTGDSLRADVLYELRIIDSRDGSIYDMRESLMAKGGADTQGILFSANREYYIEVEVTGLIRDGQEIDTSRNGIASGVVLVPEFPSQLILISASIIWILFLIVTRMRNSGSKEATDSIRGS